MNVIVTAGGATSPKDPLYEVTKGGLKAMVNIHGKPMVQWVLEALGQSEHIERVFVVGLPPETDLDCSKPLYLIDDHGSMLHNAQAGARALLEEDPSATHAILVNGDLPALRAEVIDWLVCQVQDLDQDIYYTLVERSTLEQNFPNARRNFAHLKDLEVCGGDVHCFRLTLANDDSPLWKHLSATRKTPLKPSAILGYDSMFLMMLRRLSLEGAERAVSKRLGVHGRALLCPYPEAALDVDKPAQLEILLDHLARRHAKHTIPTG